MIARRWLAFLIITVVASAYIVSCGGGAQPTVADARLNVVLILIETTRADHVSLYGYPVDTTPNINRFAERCVVFDNAYAASSWTLPSVASIFTGKWVAHNDMSISGMLTTLAESFHDAGYLTAAIVANPIVNSDAGYHQGFDVFRITGRDRAEQQAWPADTVTEMAVDWLRENHETEFFLFTFYYDPHGPYFAHEEFASQEHRDFVGRWVDENLVPAFRAQLPQPFLEDDFEEKVERIKEQIVYYDQEIMFADRQIGELLAEMERLGLLENSIVVFAADHGEGLWQRPKHPTLLEDTPRRGYDMRQYFLRGHGMNLYQEGIRVPLLVYHPRAEPARVQEALMTSEIFPTLANLLGLESRNDFDFRGLQAYLGGDPAGRGDGGPLFFSCKYQRGIFDGGYKLILTTQVDTPGGEPHLNLYRVDSDGSERVDIFERERELAGRMYRTLMNWMERSAHLEASLPGAIQERMNNRLRALGYLQ